MRGRDGHLRHEGKAASAIFHVGHMMVDSALYQAQRLADADTSAFETSTFRAANTGGGKRYGVVTLHRPSNVDSAGMMARIGGALTDIAAELPLIFPVHPRTRGNLEKCGIDLGPAYSLARKRLLLVIAAEAAIHRRRTGLPRSRQ